MCVVFVCLVYFFLLFLWLLFLRVLFSVFLCFFGCFRGVSLGVVVFVCAVFVFCCFFGHCCFLYCFHVLSGIFLLFLWRVVFVCVFGGVGVSLGVVVCLSFRAFLGVLFLRVSLAVVLALLFVNYVAGFLAFCRIYI